MQQVSFGHKKKILLVDNFLQINRLGFCLVGACVSGFAHGNSGSPGPSFFLQFYIFAMMTALPTPADTAIPPTIR